MRAPLYRVTVATRENRRTVSASSEREVALMAESVLRQHEGKALKVTFWIDSADTEGRRRVAAYLTDVALELEL